MSFFWDDTNELTYDSYTKESESFDFSAVLNGTINTSDLFPLPDAQFESQPSSSDESASGTPPFSSNETLPLESAFAYQPSWNGNLSRPSFSSSTSASSSSPEMRVQSIQDSQQQHTHYQPQQHPLTFASASSTTQAAAPLSSLLASLLQYNSKYGNAIQLPPSIISPPLPIASQLQASASYSPQQPKIESPGVFPITAAYNPSSSTSPDSSSSSLPAIFPRDTANFKDASSSSKKRRASPSSHQPVSSVVIEEGEEVSDSEAWRPTAEEYKKLSSKEKRQLRNKASARNFRLRRKEQVTTLESQVNDREKLIEAIRAELGREKMENAVLRSEIQNLKSAFAAQPTRPNGSFFPSSTNQQAKTSSPPAPPLSELWSADNFDLSAYLANTTSTPSSSSPSSASNHLLAPSFPNQFSIPDVFFPQTYHQLQPSSQQAYPSASASSTWGGYESRDKGVEAFNNQQQFWGRLAKETAPAAEASKPSDALAGLMLPKFFSSPSAAWKLRASLPVSKPTTIASSASLPTTATTLCAQSSTSTSSSPQLALLATLAQNTISSRLSSAFLDAFTTIHLSPTSSSIPTAAPNSSARTLDASKISAVLTGKARVEIVPIAPSEDDKLEAAFKGLSVQGSSASSRTLVAAAQEQPYYCPLQSMGSSLGLTRCRKDAQASV